MYRRIKQTSIQACLVTELLIITCLTSGLIDTSHGQEPSATAVDQARNTEQQQVRREILEEDTAAIERMREELTAQSTDISRKLTTLEIDQVNEALVEQARLDTRAARLRQEELQADSTNSERRLKELEQSIRDLEAQEQLLSNPARTDEDNAKRAEQLNETSQSLAQQRLDLELEKTHLENLRNRLVLIKTRLSLLGQWQSRVEELYRLQQERTRQEAQEDLRTRLQRTRQSYLEQIAALNRRLEQERQQLSPAQQRRLETEIKTVEEQASLVQVAIRLADIGNDLTRLETLAARRDTAPEELRGGSQQLRGLLFELQNTHALLQQKLDLFQQQREVIERRNDLTDSEKALANEERRLLDALLGELKTRHQQIQQDLEQAQSIQTQLDSRYREILSQDLLARKTLPATIKEWNQLLEGIVGVPRILLYQVRLSLESAFKSMADASIGRWMGLVLSEIILVLALFLLRHGSKRLTVKLKTKEELRFYDKVGLFFTHLLQRNLAGIGFALAMLIAIWISQVPQPGQGIIVTLVLLWIGIKIPINIVWMILAAPHIPPQQQRPELYRQWFFTLLMGGILAVMTILVHLSGVSETIIDIFDRILMLYLLLVSVPLLRARRFVVDTLARHYGHSYWFTGLRVITFFLRLSLLSAALLGLAGYLNLAWSVAWYLGMSILVLVVWLIIQGLFKDLMELLKDYAANRPGETLLWPHEIVDPLYKVISILLFLGACTLVLKVSGWDEESTITRAWQLLVVTVFIVIAAYEVVYFIAGNVVKRTQSILGSSLVRHSRQPLGFILPLTTALIILPTLPLPEESFDLLRHSLILAQIAAVSWLVIRMVSVMDDVAVHRFTVETQDKLGARRVRTQMKMLRQIVMIAVYMVAIAAMMMTFPRIRQLGAGLMASAGVAGLVIGIAARPFLANIIAGIQIGLTQPIRLEDEVIVEGEWGRIAEINPTHVIIQIWDDRRLVVPLNYFNEKPFENWTRTSTNLLGSVFIHVDYTFPVEELRQELKRVLDENELWDRRAWVLQVVNATPQTMELRALMSAPDAPTAWDLRCQVREKLIEFIQKNYPQCLPRTRAILEGNLENNTA